MRDLIDASPAIQYRVELFATSLEDNLRKTSVTVADRRALLEQYHSRWDKLQGDRWRNISLPAHTKRVLEGGVLGCIMESKDDKLDVHFIQLPSVSREVKLKQWVVRGLPKCDTTLKMNPEVDLLVVPEVVNEGRYVIRSFRYLLGDDSRPSTFRIHILRLSDGLPYAFAPVDPVVHYVDYQSKEIVSGLNVLVSGHRLVAMAAFEGTPYFERENTLIVWDWRSGERVLVSSYPCPPQNKANVTIAKKTSHSWVDQVQFVDDYRIVGIKRRYERSPESDRSVVMWDTTTIKERQVRFGMPTGTPRSLVDYNWVPAGAGLHRSDPARRAIGIQCRRIRVKAGKEDTYLIVVNAADMCAHASRKRGLATQVSWKTWERSTTVIQTASSVIGALSISGCRLFAMTKGLSGLNFIELLRIYDFSAGTRGGRYPNRPPVRDVLLNLGRGTVDEGKKIWCFSEDNLLLFHVSPQPSSTFQGCDADLLTCHLIDPVPKCTS